MTEQSDSERPYGRRPRFSLAALLGVLVLCGVLLAWYVDHSQLKKQIPPPRQLQTAIFTISNAEPELAAKKLTELFPSETISVDEKTKSLIVTAEQRVHDQIKLILLHIDRKTTDFVRDTTLSNALEDTNTLTEAK